MQNNETNLENSSDSEYDNDDKDNQNFKLIYSPRSTYSKKLDREEELFNDLTLNFDPITIKIIKKHFKERLGSLNNHEFISILKNHLLSWHPEHPHREKLLVKLLRRLFSEIDLNDNGSMEWAEFTNYIIHNSNSVNNKGENNSFKLRFYSNAKVTIDTRDLSEHVGYAFYIEKYSLIGIVENDRSVLHFYDAHSFRKLKCSIDLKEIQKEIDDLELRELEEKAEKKIQQEKEEKIKIRQVRMKNQKRFMPNNSEVYNLSSDDDKSSSEDTENENALKSDDKNKKKQKRKSKFKQGKSDKAGLISNDYNNGSLNKLNSNGNQGKKTISSQIFDQKNKRTPIISNNSTNKKLTVLSTIFIQEYDVLLVSASNNRITAWKYANGEFKNANTITENVNIDKQYFMCSILMTSSPQYTMTWDGLQRYLYSGQIDGKILKWDLTKSSPVGILDIKKVNVQNKEGSKVLNTFSSEESGTPHLSKYDKKFISSDQNMDKQIKKRNYVKRDSVSYILLINKIQLLAASYFNGVVILWDTLLMDKRKVYDDHKTGIYHMTYDSTKNLLFTCGFDHEIYVYDPYIDFPVYKLSGHYGSVNNIICNEKDSELISLDVYGNLKIWDTQQLVNFQTINVNESSESNKISMNLKMLYLKKQKKIMVYGSKIQFYETDKSLNPELADDQVIFACFYDKYAKSIISFCLRKIKMWNPFTGKIKKVYEDPMMNEITAFTIDRNMKRTFLGDNTGKIKNFNMKNGKYLKDLDSHDLEINMLVHSLTLNIVVSCSIDNVIKIHDDKELMESMVIKEIKIQGVQVKAIAIIDHLQRLAIGLSSGTIKFYDIEHFRFDSDLNSEAKSSGEEVTCLFPFNDNEIIFSGHSSGQCKFMVAPPSGWKFIKFFEITNDSVKSSNNPIPVTCADFDNDNNRLFCGDQLGYISCYSLQEMFDLIERTKLPKEKNPLGLKISKDFLELVNQVKIPKLWCIEGHQESIKHLHYTNIEPNIIISTSHDLRVKIFSADTGEYIDELKQISNKYNPVPIGIKYKGMDPINKTPYKETVWRRDLVNIGLNNIEDIEENNTAEYSNKITIYNAKEKLLQNVKNSNVGVDNSNKWNLMIDIKKVQAEEDEDLRERKEINIHNTEMIMQQKSIYNENYKPLFINEMNDEQVKDFSKILSQKLRYVKLAISKANIGQNKYANMGEEAITGKKNGNHPDFLKAEVSDRSKNGKNGKSDKSIQNILNGKIKSPIGKKLKPLNKMKSVLANYIRTNTKEMTPNEVFSNCRTELEKQIAELKKPFQLLIRKTKIKPIRSLFRDNSINYTRDENDSLNKLLRQDS